eukprot:6205577-Pleurochrysis_carterae.AAC.2
MGGGGRQRASLKANVVKSPVRECGAEVLRRTHSCAPSGINSPAASHARQNDGTQAYQPHFHALSIVDASFRRLISSDQYWASPTRAAIRQHVCQKLRKSETPEIISVEIRQSASAAAVTLRAS